MLPCQRHLFNLSDDQTYLNCSYMSPLMTAVSMAGVEAIHLKANPASLTPQDFFSFGDLTKELFSQLLNIQDASQCAIIPSVSYGMATVAKNLKAEKGDEILVLGEQFPSNIYPWKTLEKEKELTIRVVNAPNTRQHRGRLWNEKILDSITHRTKLVAMGHVHWADGTLFDLDAIRERTREVGAALVIDGTQSVGALPFDVQRFQPDALIVAAYKWLMGPYSIGVAYYGDYFKDGSPLEHSWMARKGSEDFSQLIHYTDELKEGSKRFEVGESANFILTSMLSKALERLIEWTPESIQDYCAAICRDAHFKLLEQGFWVEEPDFRGEHLFGIRLPESMNLERVKTGLQQEKILVSFRGDVIRVSPHVYNTKDELDKLVEVLLTTSKKGS